MGKTVIAIMITFMLLISFNAAAQQVPKQQQVVLTPKRVEIDSNFNGKIDRIEYYDDKGQPVKIEADTTGDGVLNESIIYENGKPVKGSRDTNADGEPDIWVEY